MRRSRCAAHDGQIHGGEAEELRAGLERLLAEGDVGPRAIRDLLDRVDARDSLAHLERSVRTRRVGAGRS